MLCQISNFRKIHSTLCLSVSVFCAKKCTSGYKNSSDVTMLSVMGPYAENFFIVERT